MADKFEAVNNNVEHNSLKTGDHAAGKVTFSEIMQNDHLTEAMKKSDAAVAAATARVAAIQDRIVNYFGDDKKGYEQFQLDQAYYQTA